MKKETLWLAAGIAGAAALATGISLYISKLLIDEALDRDEPQIMVNARKKVVMTPEVKKAFENSIGLAENLKKCEDIERVEIESFDGLKLVGHWYPCENAKRVIVAMHGWRSDWARDFAPIVEFWHENGCSVLFAEQRGQGESEGNAMGFGMMERYDCLDWTNFICRKTGNALPVYLIGISMGATTVLMTADADLPANVAGIISDCGFTSPKAIWKHVIEDNIHLSYAIRENHMDYLCRNKIRYGADACSTVEALKKCKVPVLFIHGTADSFVPIEMTYENYSACASEKEILVVPGAEHGMSYIVDRAKYEESVVKFFDKHDAAGDGANG